MHRIALLLVVLPLVLLTQSARLGHSHGSQQPADHDLRPHLHISLATSPLGDHGHSHDGTIGHHHDDEDDDDSDTLSMRDDPSSDHDADAIYLVAMDIVVAQRSHLDGGDRSSVHPATDSLNAFGCCSGPLDKRVSWSRPPPSSGSPCPIYVRQLSLLI